jgi:hypothetical protein
MASRSTKLVALAVATGTVVVAGSLPATAASGDTAAKSYVGTTAGYAIQLALNLPALTINETIAIANGQVRKTESASLSGTATASLFRSSGPTAAVFDALNKSSAATLGGILKSSADLVPATTDPLGLIKVSAGNVSSQIVPAPATSVTQSLTGSKILSLNVGLGGALAGPVQSATTAVTGGLSTVLALLTSTDTDPNNRGVLTKILDAVAAAASSAPSTPASPVVAGVISAVQNLPTQINSLVGDLTTSINGLTADGGLLKIGLIGTDQVVKPNGKGLTAVTTSQIGDLSVLGGLVGIDALKTIATASANGVKGGALADVAKSSLAHVKIGSLANIQANVDKLEATVSSLGLDAVNQALGLPSTSTLVTELLNQLTGLLAQAGVQVGYLGTDVSKAEADGTSASAATEGIGIRVGLPAALTSALGSVTAPVNAATGFDASKPLLEIKFVPASASVQQENSPVAPTLASTSRVAHPAGPAPQKKLAYTGTSLPLAAGLGSLLLVGAAVGSRRRRASEI